jgi:hypothetical protein
MTRISHGSYFTIAAEENILSNTSIHGGIRQKMGVRRVALPTSVLHSPPYSKQGRADVEHDESATVIQKIRDRVVMRPVYSMYAKSTTLFEFRAYILCGNTSLDFDLIGAFNSLLLVV